MTLSDWKHPPQVLGSFQAAEWFSAVLVFVLILLRVIAWWRREQWAAYKVRTACQRVRVQVFALILIIAFPIGLVLWGWVLDLAKTVFPLKNKELDEVKRQLRRCANKKPAGLTPAYVCFGLFLVAAAVYVSYSLCLSAPRVLHWLLQARQTGVHTSAER